LNKKKKSSFSNFKNISSIFNNFFSEEFYISKKIGSFEQNIFRTIIIASLIRGNFGIKEFSPFVLILKIAQFSFSHAVKNLQFTN
jgi:hypothetical protein